LPDGSLRRVQYDTVDDRHPQGRIRQGPQGSQGKVIIGHPIDAAIEAFPPYAKLAGINPDDVNILRSNSSMAVNAKEVVDGNVDGVFGFVNTIIAALRGINIDGREKLDFLEFQDLVPEFYGNALMMMPDFIAKHPEAVKGLVAAVNRGVVETLKDPEAALNAVEKMAPNFKREVDGPRMMGTLRVEMAHPEGKSIGIGDVDDKRIERSISLMADACRLPRSEARRNLHARIPPAVGRKSEARRQSLTLEHRGGPGFLTGRRQ
jgi:NitT/TauT family transport system substrate-binding protein